jgi:hypothetical protein
MGDKKGMHVHYRVDNKALKIWLAAIQGFFEEGAKG